MRVLLRQTQSGRYYAKHARWVKDPTRALDLKGVRCANQIATHRRLGGVEIVLEYGQPLGELTMPLWQEDLPGLRPRRAPDSGRLIRE